MLSRNVYLEDDIHPAGQKVYHDDTNKRTYQHVRL